MLLIALPALAAKERIGSVEFFGYDGLDLAAMKALRDGLHVKPGQRVTEETVEKIQANIAKILGQEAASVDMTCCDAKGRNTLYIGLSGKSVHPFPYNPEPKDDLWLSQELQALSERFDAAWLAAVKKGGMAAQEDDSNGYALLKDAAARTVQLQMREYAIHHEEELLHVLKDSQYEGQRALAATALGYADFSPAQVAALVSASRDSDGSVRNVATRALGVLLRWKPQIAAQVPVDQYAEMLNSPAWTDRNKSSLILLELTKTRNAAVLKTLHAKCLTALIEMASWQTEGHAFAARVILGRMSGMPEEQVINLANNNGAPELIRAVHLMDVRNQWTANQ